MLARLVISSLLGEVWLAPRVQRAPRLGLVDDVAQHDVDGHLELASQLLVARPLPSDGSR